MSNQNSAQIYVKDIIGKEYKTWKKGDIILLDSPVGTGKTTFCETLAEYAKCTNDKILYLASRSSKYEEFIRDTKKYKDVFIYRTYQKLEQDIAKSKYNALNAYLRCKYIFIDECHYFTDDIAIPDSNASLAEEWLRTHVKSAIRIYASGTGTIYFKTLKHRLPEDQVIHIYSAQKDMEYITGCYIYKKEESIDIINKILTEEPKSKILYFVTNTKHMENFFDTYGYEQADYLCSKNTKDTLLKKICNLRNEESIQINKQILFATKTIDNGINIIDKQLKYIFCEMSDINTIIQCLGRKRPQGPDDTCTFFICDQDAKSLSLYKGKIKKHIRTYEEYRRNPTLFLLDHKNDHNINKNGSVFILTPGSSEIKIDKDRLAKYKRDLEYFEYIEEHGFLATLRRLFKKFWPYLAEIVEPYFSVKDQVIMFLDSIAGQKFYDDNKKVIQDFFKEVMPYRYSYGIKTINAWLDELLGNDYLERFISAKDKKRLLEDGTENPNRDKTYWIISQNEVK